MAHVSLKIPSFYIEWDTDGTNEDEVFSSLVADARFLEHAAEHALEWAEIIEDETEYDEPEEIDPSDTETEPEENK